MPHHSNRQRGRRDRLELRLHAEPGAHRHRVFATEAEDHGNCSVGSLTHGFKTMEEIAHMADVAALCETGWVTPEAVAKIAVVREKPTSVVYGPLRDMPVVQQRGSGSEKAGRG